MKIVYTICMLISYVFFFFSFKNREMSIEQYMLIDFVILLFGFNVGMWVFYRENK